MLAAFVSASQANLAYDHVKNLLLKGDELQQRDEKIVSTVPPVSFRKNDANRKRFNVKDLLFKHLNMQNNQTPLTSLEELERYLSESINADYNEDVLGWWFKNKSSFPRLYPKAIKHLIIPATSADSERVFSTSGLVLSEKRSRLSAEHANMLIFLNKNQD